VITSSYYYTRLCHMRTYLLCPSTLILSLAWSCPFLRLGLDMSQMYL
jgi:hypothetical protein